MSDIPRRTKELVELLVRTKQIDPDAYQRAKKMGEENRKKRKERSEGATE